MAIDDVVYHSKARLLLVILGSFMFVAPGISSLVAALALCR